MDRKSIIEKLILLSSHNPADCEGDLDTLCDINVKLICDQCHINLEDVANLDDKLKAFNNDDKSPIWKYIILNFHLLNQLCTSLDRTPSSDVLSVQQMKSLKNVAKNVVGMGIRCNLSSNLPAYRKLPGMYNIELEPILISYNRLAATTYGLIECLRCIKLRGVILTECFKPILTAVYQIVYCPLRKPNDIEEASVFIMTRELYDRFVKEKVLFKKKLDYLQSSVSKAVYVRETMLLPDNKSVPMWFKKAIRENLNNIMCSNKGIETIAWAMIDASADYDPNDTAKNWKIFDVLSKLILNLRGKHEFKLICDELVGLLNAKDDNGSFVPLFENLYIACVKKLYTVDQDLCKRILLPAVLGQLDLFADKNHKFNEDQNVTGLLVRAIRLLRSCFIESGADSLPIELLTPSIEMMISLYRMIAYSSHDLQNDLREILIKYLGHAADKNPFFDVVLFDMKRSHFKSFRGDIYLENIEGNLIIKTADVKFGLDINTRGDILMKLCRNESNLSVDLFVYLLHVLTEHDKYLKSTNNKDLLETEAEFVLNESLQRKLAVYQLLAQLAEDQSIQDHIRENPIEIIKYIEDVLYRTLISGIHRKDDVHDTDEFQTVFTLVMILQALVMNTDKHDHFKRLLDVLQSLFRECTHSEFKNLLKSIIRVLDDTKFKKSRQVQPKSEFEKALDDICDPLLPVRGHALMTLTRLIEEKNPEAMERKNYILNIFQQHLKDDDSFIYLSAINGLAAMGFVFPDVVLNALTGEYSDFTRKSSEDGMELRLKLGEILVKTTKNLGEMAPKYKSLLLNAFLVGAKDEDHLIRASALSNLGELCRVLGYKLGPIVVEVLVCVHAIITTDKAVEARRAAVTVIRQLLAGLDVEMVTFLKDHILEIYRTLKMIYQNDKDDVMKLQAQLALEELNENVKKYLVAGPRLEADRRFVIPEKDDIRIGKF